MRVFHTHTLGFSVVEDYFLYAVMEAPMELFTRM